MIETRLLNYFLVIAREQNITRAAQQLHVSQPTLSKQMADLEARLGVRLFCRTNKNTTLTEDGVLFRTRAQELMELMEKTETEFQSGAAITGDIYFGCGETHLMDDVTAVFQELHREHPGIRLQLFSGDAPAVLERLDKGLLDACLLCGAVSEEKYNTMAISGHDTLGLLMPEGHPLAQKERLAISDLGEIPLILPNQSLSAFSANRSMLSALPLEHMVASYNLLHNATYLVRRNIGCAICFDHLADTGPGTGLAFRPLHPAAEVPACIVTKKYQVFSKAVRAFLDRLAADGQGK